MPLLLSTVITLKVSYSLLAVSDLYNNRGENVGPVVVYLMRIFQQTTPSICCACKMCLAFLPNFTSPPVPHEIISLLLYSNKVAFSAYLG